MTAPRGLSAAERKVWAAFPAGTVVNLGTGNDAQDDPERGEGWGVERQVRAGVLLRLLAGEVQVPPGQAGIVRLHGARVTGKIDLPAAELGHSLMLVGCRVSDGIDLSASATRGLFLRRCCTGPVRLVGTTVKDQVDLTGTHIDGKGGPGLHADGLTARSVFCNEARVDGGISLVGAAIASQFRLRGAQLHGKGADGVSLNCQRLAVSQEMFCDHGFRAECGIILDGASISRIIDDKEDWPARLDLDGLTYDDLTSDSNIRLPAADRLDWLSRNSSGYIPQAYQELAAYYRRLGHDDQARLVLLKSQRRRSQKRSWPWRSWGWLQDGLTGYGYAPGRALAWLLGAFLLGWLTFSIHRPAPAGSASPTSFNPALYTLDVLVPAPALGSSSDWDPHGLTLAMAASLHVLGWLLAITVIAAITRSFSKD